MASLIVNSVTKKFSKVTALDNVSLEIDDGQFIALLGPSGCGKTTLLRIIAGFEAPDTGFLKIDNRIVADKNTLIPPEKRNLGMVFQAYALWPHMTVYENIAYGLKIRKIHGSELSTRIDEALSLVGLSGYSERKIGQLSGGQSQRVALARCLALRPSLVLLDEPLANLDAHLREVMQTELKLIQRQSGAIFMFVTHDQTEAISMADKIAVMNCGKIEQFDTPEVLFSSPATHMVSSFIGNGMILPVKSIKQGKDFCCVQLWGNQIQVRSKEEYSGDSGFICVKPHDMDLVPASDTNAFAATVVWKKYQGKCSLVGVSPKKSPDTVLRVEVTSPSAVEGDLVHVRVKDAWLISQECVHA